MSGIALLFPFLRAEAGGNIIRIPLRGLQQLILAGRLIVGHRPLGQMAEAVQLVIVLQIGEDLVLVIDDIIGVQVAVLQLGRADDIDGFIRRRLQLRIRMLGQGIAHRLDPFGKIAVLEQAAVKAVLQMIHILRKRLKLQRPLHGPVSVPLFSSLPVQLSRHLKVSHGKAGIRIRNPVVERLPLIGDHFLAHQLHLVFPEIVRHLHLS